MAELVFSSYARAVEVLEQFGFAVREDQGVVPKAPELLYPRDGPGRLRQLGRLEADGSIELEPPGDSMEYAQEQSRLLRLRNYTLFTGAPAGGSQ